MDITSPNELHDGIDSVIEYLSMYNDLYIALELAYQLRDEIVEIIPDTR